MRLLSKENFRWYGIVVGLAGLLLLLAILQYRSVKAVGEVTTAQMRASLEGSLLNVRQGLEGEVAPLCRELQSDPNATTDSGFQQIAARFERWRRAAAHPNLVAAVYIWQQRDGSNSQLFQLNAGRRDVFEPINWPEDLSKVRQELTEFHGPAGEPSRAPNPPAGFWPGDHLPHTPPDYGSPDGPRPPFDGEGPPDQMRGSPAPDRPLGQSGTTSYPRPPRSGFGMPPPQHRGFSMWMIDQNVPALIHAFRESPMSGGFETRPPMRDLIVVVLDRSVLVQHILPELVQRYFGANEQSSYDIAVTGNEQQGDLYRSHPGFRRQKNFEPDAALNLFGWPAPLIAGKGSILDGMFPPVAQGRPSTVNRSFVNTPMRFPDEGMVRIEPIGDIAPEQCWRIVAKHRAGSVEAAVAGLTLRNLMFNFAVLLVLAATMAMIIAATLRGGRLARLQMDFVANVSHELRTPLTGIISAAQNIADGLIDDKRRVARYGKAIVGEAQQLSDLVEQILLFSAAQQDRHRYHLEPVDVAEVIDVSLGNTSTLLRRAGVTVEREIQPELPKVSADFKALTHCLQNLIANAVKYGGDGHWVGIKALATNGSSATQEVRVSIADKGIGIREDDLHHIFEPFYRTAEVTTAQIHGSGLGLPLAKRIAEAMGGQLTVASEPGKGSTFTVHLPLNGLAFRNV